jgi:hypothetical protein
LSKERILEITLTRLKEPWMNVKADSIKQEKSLARQLGGRLTPASGAGFRKGDISLPEQLIESKATEKDRYTLRRSELEKIEVEAIKEGKTPVFIVEIQTRRYYVFRECDVERDS